METTKLDSSTNGLLVSYLLLRNPQGWELLCCEYVEGDEQTGDPVSRVQSVSEGIIHLLYDSGSACSEMFLSTVFMKGAGHTSVHNP